jgi:hypothetical protein
VFRRRREIDESDDYDESGELDEYEDDDLDDERTDGEYDDTPVSSSQEPYAVVARTNPKGPWDIEDVPTDDEVPRLDLGGMHVPVPDGVDLQVEVQDEIPMAVTLIDGSTALQVHAFAAPKSSGLWNEVRAEIGASLTGSGGSAEDATGPFGTELRAKLPVENAAPQPARFFGVDGPRWFLRGLMTGAGATDPGSAKRLEEAFRQVVVNRGTDAMAPRDMIPIHLPREAYENAPQPVEEPDRRLRLPERGPEITEIQ